MSITTEKVTRVLPDIDLVLIEELEKSVPCDYADHVYPEEDPCQVPAAFIATFRSTCGGGKPMRPGFAPLCGPHVDWFARGEYRCVACDHSVGKEGWHHLITTITEL